MITSPATMCEDQGRRLTVLLLATMSLFYITFLQCVHLSKTIFILYRMSLVKKDLRNTIVKHINWKKRVCQTLKKCVNIDKQTIMLHV